MALCVYAPGYIEDLVVYDYIDDAEFAVQNYGPAIARVYSVVAADADCPELWQTKLLAADEMPSGSGATLSAADGAILAAAVLGAWAVAWVCRQVIDAVRYG